MLFKMTLTVIAGVFTLFVAIQNMTFLNLRLFRTDVSVPFIVLIGVFLMIGFFVGLLWRNGPHFHRGRNQVPLIRADMKVCR